MTLKHKNLIPGNAPKPGPAKAPKLAVPTPQKPPLGRRSRAGRVSPDRVNTILDRLDEAYPEAECALLHSSPWQLLIATILSAQCTDVRVNLVTPALFQRFPTPAAMSKATLPQLESLIRSTGFFHNKAKSIQGTSLRLVKEFGGQVPQTLAELITLPGVARKTANVVLGVSFKKSEGIVVDTHVFRIARRLELSRSETAQKVESDLMKIIPPNHWIALSHQFIHHGRQVCMARKPKCNQCPLEQLCNSKDKTWSS